MAAVRYRSKPEAGRKFPLGDFPFRRKQWNEISVFILFLLLALGFWLLQDLRPNGGGERSDAPAEKSQPPAAESRQAVATGRLAEKKLLLDVVCPDIPAGYALKLYPSSVEATFSIPASRFRELTRETAAIRLPFSEFTQRRETGVIKARLTLQPSWVSGCELAPEELVFIIERRND